KQEQAVGAAYREKRVTQGKRMALERPRLVGIPVEQQVIVLQQRPEVLAGLQHRRQSNRRLDAERRAVGIDWPIQRRFVAAETENRFAVLRRGHKDKGKGRAKRECDIGVMSSDTQSFVLPV